MILLLCIACSSSSSGLMPSLALFTIATAIGPACQVLLSKRKAFRFETLMLLFMLSMLAITIRFAKVFDVCAVIVVMFPILLALLEYGSG